MFNSLKATFSAVCLIAFATHSVSFAFNVQDQDPTKVLAVMTLSASANDGDYAGIVFGYKGPQDYWMLVIQKGDASTGGRYLYHVVNGCGSRKVHPTVNVVLWSMRWPG